ncbi:SusC/RagA family TonB-linked outer membrane protein [uncultured Chitinophaga sp.]|uniref:SusC/RagA family TonB-linked outer membrane protein n=1 Tax=uncultured Chitinophaga sp. TaxID=339340 RepID=UPI0025F9918A|nr:SusC/RagA family TonB-linked outer membrane protein [uncultured Chitinophaga sp.]
MRFGFIVAMLGCTTQLLFASTTKGQTIEETPVSVNITNQPLLSALKQIEQQTVFRFAYNKQQLNALPPLTYSSKNASVRRTLEQLLKSSGYGFRQLDNKIIIFQQPVAKLPSGNFETLVEEPAEVVQQEPVKKITGVVIDDKTGEPVIGATVMVKGRTVGTTTNVKGEFSIETTPGSTLVIMSLGFEKLEVIAAGSRVNARLKVSAKTLTDVVVTGLYSRPAQNFTGAATVLTKENLSKVSNGNVLAAISALDPSFQIPENIGVGSNPNVLPDVQIRGGNSIVNPSAVGTDVLGYSNNKVNQPLFILDGFEVSMQRIFDLDINRIAKVTILKDAAATSIYGSRAANGVVIMELMTPQDGKLRVSINSNFSMELPDLRDYDLLNAREKLDLEVKGGIYKSSINAEQERLNVLYNARLAQVQRGVNTYWLSQPLQTSFGAKQNLYIEGGGNNALYGVSLTYDKRNGVMKGSDRENFSANTYLSYRLKNFQFRNDLTLGYNKANNSPYGTFQDYTILNPYWAPQDANGRTSLYLEDYSYSNGSMQVPGTLLNARVTNPLYNGKLAITDGTRYQNIMNNTSIQWTVTEWLRLNGRLSVQKQNDSYGNFLPPAHTRFAGLTATQFNERGSYRKVDGNRTNVDGNFTADFNRQFGQHMFFGTVGMNFQTNSLQSTDMTVTGFQNERLDNFFNAVQYLKDSKPIGVESKSRLAGYLGNLSYAYNNRYLLDFSYRLDGSSLFGSDKRFANFWSVGGGWNIHNEKFFQNDYINQLKLRYSFGYTGSQKFDSYLALTTAQYYQVPYAGQYGLYLLGYGNSNLAWQQTQKNNFGADITVLDKVTIRGNYFIEKTQGALATINTAPSTGFPSYKENMGDLTNKGWEAYFNYAILSRKRDNINVFANFFSSKGEYTRLSNSLKALNKVADTSTSTKPLVRYAEGMSPTAIWAVQSKGIDPANGREIFVTRDGKETNTYSTADQVIAGDARPKLEGTFGTNLELNGIGFNVYMRFRIGGQTYNETLADRVENANIRYNVDRRVYEDRWQKPGDHTFFKGIVTPEGYAIGTTPTLPTSRFVQDYSYLAAESASVYYRFTDNFNKRTKLSNTKISFYTGQLFRLSTVKQERGLSYPYSQSFTLLLQTSF